MIHEISDQLLEDLHEMAGTVAVKGPLLIDLLKEIKRSRLYISDMEDTLQQCATVLSVSSADTVIEKVKLLHATLLRVREECGGTIPATICDAIDNALGIPLPVDGVFRSVVDTSCGCGYQCPHE